MVAADIAVMGAVVPQVLQEDQVPGTFLEQVVGIDPEQVVGIDPVLEVDHYINRLFQDCEKKNDDMTQEIELVGNCCDLFKNKRKKVGRNNS